MIRNNPMEIFKHFLRLNYEYICQHNHFETILKPLNIVESYQASVRLSIIQRPSLSGEVIYATLRVSAGLKV